MVRATLSALYIGRMQVQPALMMALMLLWG